MRSIHSGKQLVGGRAEQRERKDGAVVKGNPSAFVQDIPAQDLR